MSGPGAPPGGFFPGSGSGFDLRLPSQNTSSANASSTFTLPAAPTAHTPNQFDNADADAALLELARLSPEDMATVLSVAGMEGLDISALMEMGFGRGAAPPIPTPATTTPVTGSTSTPSTASTSVPAASASASASTASAAASAASARPDLVRLADLVTHASLMLSQPGGGPRKYTRSRRGCLTCRARKVKCDEVRPRCLRCAAMGRECSWDEEKAERGKKPRRKAAPASTPAMAKASTSAAQPLAPAPAIAPKAPPLAQAPVPAPSSTFPSIAPQAPQVPLSFLPSAVPPVPAPPPAPSVDTLASAGLPPSLAKALADLAGPVRPNEGRPAPTAQVTQPLPSFNAPDEPAAKRFRTNATTGPEVGMPFDFGAWVASVSADGGSAASATTQPRKDSAEVIELARSAVDAQGRIQLEAEGDYAQAGGIDLSMKGTLARRRSASASAAAARNSASPIANSASPQTVSNLIKLATQPSRGLDPFMHAFPTASTRGLFQHYVDSTAGIVTALGRSKPRDNPFLQVSLPLVVGDSSAPGISALRFALLTTSAAHIFHLRGDSDAADMCDRLKKLAIGYTVISQSEIEKERAAAVLDPSTSAVVSQKIERDNDLALAACVVLVTRDVLSGDTTWKANLQYALASIRRRGGPEALMAADPQCFMRRFVLEQLATHDVFSCFTTGGEPALLLPHARWWFDAEKSSTSAWEWESVENQFGISRVMVELIGRICALCARKNRLGTDASLDDPELAPVAAHLRAEAETLIAELDQVAVSLRSLPLQRRVQYGDHIYRLTMTLHLLTEILCLPGSHPRVRALVPAALELCSEISSEPVMLVWPLLICARAATREEREWIRSLAGTYAEQYCRDLQIAQELTAEMWRRQDEGHPPQSWHSLMAELGKEVLLI